MKYVFVFFIGLMIGIIDLTILKNYIKKKVFEFVFLMISTGLALICYRELNILFYLLINTLLMMSIQDLVTMEIGDKYQLIALI